MKPGRDRRNVAFVDTQLLPVDEALRRLAALILGMFPARRRRRPNMLDLATLPRHRLRDLGLSRTDAAWRDAFPSQAVGDPRCLGRELSPGTKA